MKGLVSLVGAGCGAGLITQLGVERLRQCDAVVYDDLIPPETLMLAPEAEHICMGKRAGRHSAGQEEICARLIQLAREGRRVVRLKGGDPYVFGRGGEEMLALMAAGVPCEEIPGVTSAIAVPAMAGIPVTHRGVSRGFAVVTAHTGDDDGLPGYFAAMAGFPGTLVVLMGLGRLAQIAQSLVEAGRAPETPCAVVSGGGAPQHYCIRGTLADIAARAAGAEPPAVIVIGAAAALELRPGYSLPLDGVLVGLTGTRRMNEKLAGELRALGAETFTACELELAPLPEADNTPTDCDCLAFTSAAGVELYFERLLKSGRDARSLAAVRLAAIGRATAAALASHGLRADIVPEAQTGASLASALLAGLPEGARICLYRSAQGDGSLAGRLRARFDVRDIRAYTAAPGAYTAPRRLVERAGVLAFASAAGARAALERLAPVPEGTVLAAIGAPTARALQGMPNRVVTAAEPSAAALAQAIYALYTQE